MEPLAWEFRDTLEQDDYPLRPIHSHELWNATWEYLQQILLAAKQQKELELQQSATRLATKEKEIQHSAYRDWETDRKSVV